MIAPLVKKLKLDLKGGTLLERLASRIVLGLELEHIKKNKGYAGIGSWQAWRKEVKAGERMPWTELCTSQAGITEEMAAHYYQCGEAVKQRLRYSDHPDANPLFWSMAIPPSERTHLQRAEFVARIATIGLDEGDTQTYLRKLYRAAQATDSPRLPDEGEKSPWPHERVEDLELQKLLRLRNVIKEEVSRRMTKHTDKTLHREELSPDMAVKARLALAAVRSMRQSNNIGQ